MFTKNQIVELNITDMGQNGEGVGRVDGYALFVKDAVEGDRVRAKITKCTPSYGFARLEKVLEASPHRVEPACPIARPCGGCQLQAMAYPAQVAWKERQLYSCLERIGGFSKEVLEEARQPMVAMEVPFRYRNKSQFPIGVDKDGYLCGGFYAGRTHVIVPVEDCWLSHASHGRILEALLSHMEKYAVLPYDEKSGRGWVRHLLIRENRAGEVLVCLVINGKKKPGTVWMPVLESLVDEISKVAPLVGLCVNENTRRDNVIMGEVSHTLWGEGRLEDTICLEQEREGVFAPVGQELSFSLSPSSFFQVNAKQMPKLYGLAVEYAELGPEDTVIDLYCGIGTISLFLAQRAKMVYGVEWSAEAVEDARRNAQKNGISNVRFMAGDADKALADLASQGIRGNTVVLDPPRRGCDASVLEKLLEMAPERIVYVSCNPAALARDLARLAQGGYRMERVRGVDQFGQTGHVETVVLMSKVK